MNKTEVFETSDGQYFRDRADAIDHEIAIKELVVLDRYIHTAVPDNYDINNRKRQSDYREGLIEHIKMNVDLKEMVYELHKIYEENKC